MAKKVTMCSALMPMEAAFTSPGSDHGGLPAAASPDQSFEILTLKAVHRAGFHFRAA